MYKVEVLRDNINVSIKYSSWTPAISQSSRDLTWTNRQRDAIKPGTVQENVIPCEMRRRRTTYQVMADSMIFIVYYTYR